MLSQLPQQRYDDSIQKTVKPQEKTRFGRFSPQKTKPETVDIELLVWAVDRLLFL
jgi:hypothetical protein